MNISLDDHIVQVLFFFHIFTFADLQSIGATDSIAIIQFGIYVLIYFED